MTTANSGESQNAVLSNAVGFHPTLLQFCAALHAVIGNQREKLATSSPSLPRLSSLGTPTHAAMGAALTAAKTEYERRHPVDTPGVVTLNRNGLEETESEETESEDEAVVEQLQRDAVRGVRADEDATDAGSVDEDAAPDPEPESASDEDSELSSADSSSADAESDDESEPARKRGRKVRWLNRWMRHGKSYRMQRSVRPALLRDILQSFPQDYAKRRPTPAVGLLRDIGVALDRKSAKPLPKTQ